MIKLDWYVGLCRDEAAFKRKTKAKIEAQNPGIHVLYIENEGEEPGMPDTLLVDTRVPGVNKSMFIEFKYASKDVVTFKPDQIRWYRRNPKFSIEIYVYRQRDRLCYMLTPKEVIAVNSTVFYMPKEGLV